jgi:hypothetical protein
MPELSRRQDDEGADLYAPGKLFAMRLRKDTFPVFQANLLDLDKTIQKTRDGGSKNKTNHTASFFKKLTR